MAVRVCQQGRLRGEIQFLEVQEGLDDNGRLLPVKEQELDESQQSMGQSQTLNKNPTYCKGKTQKMRKLVEGTEAPGATEGHRESTR